MALRLATPGVYIEEKNAFGTSAVGLPTAVPAFVGYTQKTVKDGKSLIGKPVRITSLAEYVEVFGTGFRTTFNIQAAPDGEDVVDISVDGEDYIISPDATQRFLMYDSIRLFYANGGATAYIITVGSHKASSSDSPKSDGDDGVASAQAGANEITKDDLETCFQALITEEAPTLLVIPEAIMLEEADCHAIQQAMLQHCGFKMQNRFSLLDIYNGHKKRTYDEEDIISRFREGIGANFLNYGAAYYPWLFSSVVQDSEINFKNISNLDFLQEVLTKEAEATLPNERKVEEAKTEITKLTDEEAPALNVHQTLGVISPTYKEIMARIREQLNVIPPSAAMAGVYSMVDTTRGVWKAPANVSVSSVISPMIKMTTDDQEDLNVTTSGKSVNGIRSFPGEGTIVWGARTLDGNSQDWRYINVRRTMIYIEQSIKIAAKNYVFEPNTANTWVNVRSLVVNFLDDLWKQGGLVGTNSDQAYEVLIGLGQTMTPNDILDGIMRVTVKVAISRPAEFIVLTFQQKMQES